MVSSVDKSSLLFASNSEFIEDLYIKFLQNPTSVNEDWQEFFQKINSEDQLYKSSYTNSVTPFRDKAPLPNTKLNESKATSQSTTSAIQSTTLDSIRALMLIRAYRVRGHLIAKLDPLELEDNKQHPELDPMTYGFCKDDYDRPIFVDGVLGLQWATIREMLEVVHETYCDQIGIEFMHIQEPEEKSWIQQEVEKSRNKANIEKEDKISILHDLTEAEGFEHFLDLKYKGSKRFSLEGSESTIPALETIIKTAGLYNVQELVIGMAHRGRLNVLTSIMEKSYAAVFREFQEASGEPGEVLGSGDVKYHLGASADRKLSADHKIHISLSPNPSHLEAVNPVVLGKVRAKQTMKGNSDRLEVMGILLHGDAAFSGQGLVSETFELSALKGYRTSGTIHLVINNQIGFTTSPSLARSSPYCSDIAKSVQAPIFHVNGDNPDAVFKVCRLAVDYRQRFSRDVVIDIFCYRRHGHNETDEPAFTQPIMYKAIKNRPTTRQLYSKQLIKEGHLSKAESDQIAADFRVRLEADYKISMDYTGDKADWLEGEWAGMEIPPSQYRPGETATSESNLKILGDTICSVPKEFIVHPRLKKLLEKRRESIIQGLKIDWATGEALAFGSLLLEGNPVRLSGQDVSRGTFSQRHAALFDQKTEERFIPLNNISKGQSEIELVDSMLSEAGVLGFEYGYSITDPNTLIIWEAQFGDFANGAQVIIDQFVASGESKWLRMSGLVMLLPHGYEGQGPEHSSARLERYLQLFGNDNIQVVNCTTPANYFHVLRRQMRRKFRKPLIIMSPKSLLRHKQCISKIENFGKGTRFHRIFPDTSISSNTSKIKRVVLCSGKIYYDLNDERQKQQKTDIALIRLEQIAPFPYSSLTDELSKYQDAEVIWCQEEPHNMGAWSFVYPKINNILQSLFGNTKSVSYIGREESASTATGYLKVHIKEHKSIISNAIN